MKAIKFALLISLFCFSASYAGNINGWYKINADYNYENLNSIDHYGDSLIIAVGDLGTVKRVTGYSNIEITNGHYTLNDLNSVACTDNGFFACGDGGYMIFSSDSGKTWNNAELPVSKNLIDICFYDELGYIVGEDGTILYSNDYGKNWEKINIVIKNDFLDAEFINKGYLLIAGKKGTLLKIETSNNHYEKVNLNTEKDLTCLSVSKLNSIIIGGQDSTLFISNDSADTFQQVKFTFSNQGIYKFMGFHSMLFVNDSILLGGSTVRNNLGIIKKIQCISLDKGKTWIAATNSSNSNDYALDQELKYAFVAGDHGEIMAAKLDEDINNKFEGVKRLVTLNNPRLNFRFFSRDNRGNFLVTNHHRLFISQDSGKTFNQIHELKNQKTFLTAQFIDSEHILAVEDSIYYFEENGKEYTEHNQFFTKINITGNIISRIPLIDSVTIKELIISENDCIIANGTYQYFYISLDGGQSWKTRVLPGDVDIHDLEYLGNGIIYIYGFNWENNSMNFYRSYDYGENWDYEKSEVLDDGYELFFNDPMNGWAYLTRAYQDEYKIFSTGDGGENWEMIFQTPESSYGYFKSMNFKDPHMGILITSDGLALLTNDGGETWNAEQYALSPSDAFSQTFFLENYAYIVTYYDIYRKDLSVSSASPLFRNGNNAVIYPNPAGDFIEIANLKEYTRVELYSSMGAKILETHDTRINISHLAAGIYFLKAGGKAYKFIKK